MKKSDIKTLKKIVLDIVDNGSATIRLGTAESAAFFALLTKAKL